VPVSYERGRFKRKKHDIAPIVEKVQGRAIK
jgi:hypothetical protein